MKIICLFIIVGWPFLSLGTNIQKAISNEEDKFKEVIIGILVFGITYAVFYYAGIFDLLINAL